MKYTNKLVFKIGYLVILPVIVLSAFLTFTLYDNLSKMSKDKHTAYLQEVVQNYIKYIDNKFDIIATSANKDAIYIENAEKVNPKELIQLTVNNVLADSIIYGSGVFFVKDAYNKDENTYFYSYRSGNKIIQVNSIKNKEKVNFHDTKPDWWKIPSKTRHAGWTHPYYDSLVGHEHMITYFQPFFYDNKFAGIITADISLERLNRWISNNEKKLESTLSASIYILSKDSTVVYTDNKEQIGSVVFDSSYKYIRRFERQSSAEVITKATSGETGYQDVASEDLSKTYMAFYGPLHSTKWTTIAVIPKSIIIDYVFKSIKAPILIVIGVFVLLILIISLMTRFISSPISQLSKLSLKIADGEYKTKINVKSNDEIGILADNFRLMKDKLMERELNLKEANQKLLGLDKAKNEFLKLISHEIRTPLNGIVGSAYFLSDTIEDPELQEFLEMLKESVDRLDKFSRNALEITQMQTIGNNMPKKSININELLHQIVHELAAMANEKDLQFNFQLDESLQLMAVEAYTKRTFEELISNAIKFCNNGSVISIISRKTDTFLEITITDMGEVIPLDKIKEITKPFGLAKDHYDKSIGLGLAYVQSYIELHDASIKIKSSEELTEISIMYKI